MNNEPVAYIDPYDLERLPHYDCYIGSQQLKNGIPLYTHPAKTLTADEITLLVDKIVNPDGCDIFTLIRAVEEAHGIRKAQEK